MTSAAAHLHPKRRLRLRITLLAGIEYLATCAFLATYWKLGKADGSVVLGFFLYSLVANLAVLAAIGSGASERLRDPSLTALQMCISCGRDLMGCMLMPGLWFIFAFNLFVALPFGSLQFSNRAFAWFWLVTCGGLGLSFGSFPDRLQIGFDSPGEKWLLWAFISAALARLMVFNSRISALRRKLGAKVAELDAAGRRLADIAGHDELTGLPNRRALNQRLAVELARANRSGDRFFVALVDADHFKRINDAHGHAVGDLVLQRLALLLREASRSSDLVARVGGEEFVLLLLGQARDEASLALDRIRANVVAWDWASLAPGLHVTLSVGCTAWSPGDTADTLLSRADAAMYRAKQAGRDRCEFACAAATAGPLACGV